MQWQFWKKKLYKVHCIIVLRMQCAKRLHKFKFMYWYVMPSWVKFFGWLHKNGAALHSLLVALHSLLPWHGKGILALSTLKVALDLPLSWASSDRKNGHRGLIFQPIRLKIGRLLARTSRDKLPKGRAHPPRYVVIRAISPGRVRGRLDGSR